MNKLQQDTSSPEYHLNVVKGFIGINKDWKDCYSKSIEVARSLNDRAAKALKEGGGASVLSKRAQEYLKDGDACKAHVVDISDNPKLWTKEDLKKMALHKDGVVVFDSLIKLRNMALKQDESGDYTKEANRAQQALAQLMPGDNGKTNTQNLIQFINDITDVAAATKAARVKLIEAINNTKAGIGTGAVFDLPKGVEYAPEKDERLGLIDQQKALQVLEANKVGVDASQKLEVPAGLKDAITMLQSRAA